MAPLRGKKKEEPKKKVCCNPKCSKHGREQPETNYYSTNLIEFFPDKRISLCKTCCMDLIDAEDFSGFQKIMKMINKPIYNDKFKGDYRDYIRQMSSLPQYVNDTYEHSTLFSNMDIKTISLINDKTISDEDKVYWGLGYTQEEYEYLKFEKAKLTKSFECPDYGMEMIMKDICFINLEIDKARRERNASTQGNVAKLIETRSKLMTDAKMTPRQSTGSDENEQVTFGTLIRKWENERPVPKPLDDEMKEYIDTYMIGHLAKMEGLSNEMTEKYDRELAKHTIKFEDVQKQQDLMED